MERPVDEPPAEPEAAPSGGKLLADLGPLVLFFVVYSSADVFWATGAFMVATVGSLAWTWRRERRLPTVPLATAGIVLVLGALTIALHDETFIELKPTLVYGVLAAVLLGGLALGRPLARPVLGSAIRLTPRGWTLLTLAWGLFFVVMAGANELVRRSFSTDAWVKWKVFGTLPLTFAFALALVPLMKRHEA